jgi:hypothetical protein
MLQHATTIIYLHTSMYPGQQYQCSSHHDQVANSCTTILSIASTEIHSKHHLLFSLFLAGYASKSVREKTRALNIMERMEQIGLSSNFLQSRHLLELIYQKQKAELMTPAVAEGVDWIAFLQHRGIKMVNISL